MHIDFTKGNITKQLISFSIPIMVGNLFMQLYQYVDSVIVGKFLGKEALAAVGACNPFSFMLISLVIGVSMGTTITIAQYFGKKDFDSVKKAADSLYIFLFFAYIFTFSFGIIFNEQIFNFIDLPKELLPIATEYLNIYLIGLIFLFGFNCLSAILRGVGDSVTPLKFLIFSSIVNVVLDLLFVIVFDWGVKGVAWATVTSQAISFIFAVLFTNKNSSIIKLDLLKLKYDKKIFMEGVKIGLPAGLQQLFVSLGMLAILSIVNSYGTNTIAAFTAAGRIESVIFIVPMSLALSLTSFVAQNYGANNFDRIRNGLNSGLKIALNSSFLFLIILSALAEPLMKMFTSVPEIIEIGCQYLYVFGVSYSLFATMFCYMGVLRGMRNTLVPMFITVLSLWLIRVPIANILSSYLGELGIWLASTASWAVGMALSIFYFRHFFKKKHLQIKEN
ncbi:MAG: MATE family efflux transporter [Rikenellaceae bacterium]